MADLKKVNDFAHKWLEKFGNPNIDYIELVDRYLADDCMELGFKMDCGNGFHEKYGNALTYPHKLREVIGEITDIELLGSAIYSNWRYFNHWAYSAEDILEPKNREWFIMALTRLDELSR